MDIGHFCCQCGCGSFSAGAAVEHKQEFPQHIIEFFIPDIDKDKPIEELSKSLNELVDDRLKNWRTMEERAKKASRQAAHYRAAHKLESNAAKEVWKLKMDKILEPLKMPVMETPNRFKDYTEQQLAEHVVLMMSACNLSGVVHGFSNLISRLRELHPDEGTDYFNQHPLCKAISDKLLQLAHGCQGEVYDKIENMAKGINK